MSKVLVDRLSVHFRDAAGRDVPAVDGVSFALEPGETLGIVGESGSGKSTVARALLGFARPGARFKGGRVEVDGIDVLGLAPAGLQAYRGARAAMVPQNPLSSLTPHRTNGAQLVELVRRHGGLAGAAARGRALDLMDATGLPDPRQIFDRYPHEISGGQRQRLVIAAALVARPRLIVLDEPTTALDKTVEARVLDLVSRVQADLDATLVYVSHDLNVIAALCARVLVMKDGVEVESGPTGDIFDRPGRTYTRDLVAAIPRLHGHGARPGLPRRAPVLEVAELGFAYRRPAGLFGRRRPAEKALDAVTFAIRPGETLGVLGESGSGKSTLASIVAGALSGAEGRMRLGDKDVAGPARTRPQELRRRIQMVFQDPLSSLNPAHSVEQALTRVPQRYFGVSRAEACARALAMLEELELTPDLMERRPRQLSGGQQQRVALARALIAEPDLLICDEITSALDVTIQAHVVRLLKDLQARRGLALMFISHDLAVVADLSDRMLVLEHGQVRDQGPRDRVLAAPAHPYTRRLFAAFGRNERRRTGDAARLAMAETENLRVDTRDHEPSAMGTL